MPPGTTRLPTFTRRVLMALLVLILAVGVAGEHLGRTSARLDAATTELTGTLLDLERALGYGGFINHFKNAVLRPGEPRYSNAARISLAEARDRVERIEELGQFVGADLKVAPLLETLDAYAAALARLEEIAGPEVTIAHLDAELRVDDTLALATLNRVSQEIRARFADRRRAVEVKLRVLSYVVAAMLLGGFAALTRQVLVLLRRRGARGIGEA